MDWLPSWVNQVGALALPPIVGILIFHIAECSRKRQKVYEELRAIREQTHEDYSRLSSAVARVEGILHAQEQAK